MNDKDMMMSLKLTVGDFGSLKPDSPPPFYCDISYTHVKCFGHIHPLISLFCSTPDSGPPLLPRLGFVLVTSGLN